MPIPATGTTWKAGGFGDTDSRFNTRGGLAAVLIRDNRGIATNISPYKTGVVDEVQTVTITGTPTGGTFTLTFSGQTTSAIAYNAAASAVQAALELLSTIGVDNVVVTGGPGPGTPYVVTFVESLGGRNVNQMTATGSFTGGTTPAITVTTTTAGTSLPRNWSPFAEDGNPRDDLFAVIRVDGEWITNPDPNEGFWLIGAVKEDGGPERAPNISEDNQMILQSNFPFDTDLTEEGITINFTGVETLKPLMKRLRMNLRLSDTSGNPIVEDPGTENFVIGKSIDVESVERQIILMFARLKAGKYVYTAEGYSLCKLTNIGNFRRSKTDPDAGELGYTVLPDPFLVTKDPNDPESNELIPVLYVEWTAGSGWTAIGGVPVFPGLAPVAAAVGATGATITFDEATGAGDAFTYTAEKKTGGVWSAASVNAVELDTPTAGKVRVTVGGLTTATSYEFRITAEGTNGNTAVSATSNSITTA